MRRSRRIILAAGAGTVAALLLVPAATRDALRNLRRYSAPGARRYEAAAGVLLAPFYDRVARDVAAIARTGAALEIGPGPGHLAVRVARRTELDIVAVDLDAEMVARARRRIAADGLSARVRVDEGDAANLPYPDGSVDLVFSTFSFHHWPDRVRGLDEIHRVLRPGGRCLIYDLNPAFAHARSGHGAASAAAASAFGGGEIGTVAWPFGLPGVIRLDLVRSTRT